MSLKKIGEYAKAAEAFANAYQANPKHQYADYILYAEGNCYEKMLENKIISSDEANPHITRAYSELRQKYPKSTYIHDIRKWMAANK